MHRGFLLLILLVLSPLPVLAHNGAVAVAVPVKGITIDGDLSDWPSGMRRYPLLLPEYGDAPRDSADFRASFRLGYSAAENALYLAVEVQDESFPVPSDNREAPREHRGGERGGEGDGVQGQVAGGARLASRQIKCVNRSLLVVVAACKTCNSYSVVGT